MRDQLTREDIDRLARAHEGPDLEYKVDFPDHKEKLAHECAALANSGGGTLLLGVADDGTVVGVTDPAKAYDRLVGILGKCNPPLALKMGWVETGPNQGVVYARMATGRHLHDGVFWVRNGAMLAIT